MGTFTPSDTNLGTYLELADVSETITYVDEFDAAQEVTITAQETNPVAIIITNGETATITGKYSDVFDNNIQYRTPSNTFVDVKKFTEIDVDNLSEIVFYRPDTTTSTIYTYIAEANSETKTYTITVDNDWTAGKNNLLEYLGRQIGAPEPIINPDPPLVSESQGVILGLQWLNNSGETVRWVNSSGQEVYWE